MQTNDTHLLISVRELHEPRDRDVASASDANGGGGDVNDSAYTSDPR